MEAKPQAYRNQPLVALVREKLGVLLSRKSLFDPNSAYSEYMQTTVAFIGQRCCLAEAKAVMEKISVCQDVVVTQTGNRSEPLLGWLPI